MIGLFYAYPYLVVYELAGQVHLLGRASDGENPGVGVGGGWRVPLQLHVSTRLLVNTLDGFSTCRGTNSSRQSAETKTWSSLNCHAPRHHPTAACHFIHTSTCMTARRADSLTGTQTGHVADTAATDLRGQLGQLHLHLHLLCDSNSTGGCGGAVCWGSAPPPPEVRPVTVH